MDFTAAEDKRQISIKNPLLRLRHHCRSGVPKKMNLAPILQGYFPPLGPSCITKLVKEMGQQAFFCALTGGNSVERDLGRFPLNKVAFVKPSPCRHLQRDQPEFSITVALLEMAGMIGSGYCIGEGL